MSIPALAEVTRIHPEIHNPNDTFDPQTLRWVFSEADLHELGEGIKSCEEVVIDLETTGINEHETGHRPSWPVSAKIALASITLPRPEIAEGEEPPTYILPLAHPDSPWSGRWRRVMGRIAREIQASGKPLVNQHLKFDLRWIYATTGVDLSSQFSWDTMYGSHLLDENQTTALKPRAAATFHIERWDDHDLSTPGAALQVPLFELGAYAARDTYWTWKLARMQRRIMNVGQGEDDGIMPSPEEEQDWRLGGLAVGCEMKKGATLTAIEQRGMRLDRDWVEERTRELTTEATGLFEKLAGLYDSPALAARQPSFAPTSLWFQDWAQAAVEAGDLRVGALTPTGKPQWSKSVLKRETRHGSSVAKDLLAFRRADKRLQFLRGWLDVTSAKGRIHATYWAGRVVTGRLSATSPNMQQVTKALKPAFIPSPGYLITEIDYSQIELRAAAFISRCEPMLQAYRDGQDLHRLFAAEITGKRPEDVTKEERQQGKAGDFGLLYGMSPEGFQAYADDAYDVVLTAEEAAAIHEAFFRKWDGMAQWHRRQIAEAYRTGQVISPLGRIRRLPDLFGHNTKLRSHAERNAINSPVQGFASDLMQMAAASIEGYVSGYEPVAGARIVGTVHDSIVVEVQEDDWKRITARCMRRMIDMEPILRRLGCALDVPLAAEATVSTRWGSGDVGIIA